jgi:hypothetical protein
MGKTDDSVIDDQFEDLHARFESHVEAARDLQTQMTNFLSALAGDISSPLARSLWC